jgi:hypothetical protein
VRRTFARIFRAALDNIANLLEHVAERILVEGRERSVVGPQVLRESTDRPSSVS